MESESAPRTFDPTPLARRLLQAAPDARALWDDLVLLLIATPPGEVEVRLGAVLDALIRLGGEERAKLLWVDLVVELDRRLGRIRHLGDGKFPS